MSRNYQLGTRDMAQAGRKALSRACARKELSFTSVDTIGARWALFCRFAKTKDVGKMERVTPDLLQQYGQCLARQARKEEISPAYAQNLVSAVNTVMQLVRRWDPVSPTTDCGIPERSHVREVPPEGIDRTQLDGAARALRVNGQHRGAAVAELARALGLRSKEASLLNVVAALKQARTHLKVTVSEGTKGGKMRTVSIKTSYQIEILQRASVVQGCDRALIPSHLNWKQWREGELRQVREKLQEHGIARLHDLRAAYACQRYKEITGHPAPVITGRVMNTDNDTQARKIIAQELGHGDDRVDVVAAYVGGR